MRTRIILFLFFGVITISLNQAVPQEKDELQKTLLGQTDIAPESCLKSFSVEELLDALQEDFNVQLSKGSQAFQSQDLLYLYYFLSALQMPKGNPIYIYRRDRESPTLVQKEPPQEVTLDESEKGTHYFFSTNAFRETFLESVQKKARAGTAVRPTQRIRFNNSLYESLIQTMLNRDQLVDFLKSTYDITVGSQEGTYDATTELPLHKEDLAVIAKQLADLPLEIKLLLRLKRIARTKAPLKIHEDSSRDVGWYQKNSQAINLYVSSQNEHHQEFEKTLLHELGHAVWAGMSQALQNNFTNLRWQKNEKGWRAIKSNQEFYSEYAIKKKSPEEDFAELFRMYLYEPELLKQASPQTYAFLKTFIFKDREYDYATRIPSLSIAVEEGCQDRISPTLYRAKDFLKIMYDPQTQKLICQGLFKENRKILQASLFFESPKVLDRSTLCILDVREADCVKFKDADLFYFHKAKKLNLEQLFPGDYSLTQVFVSDGNNYKVITPSTPVTIPIPGQRNMHMAVRPNPFFEESQASFSLGKKSQDGAQVTLPVKYSQDIQSIKLYWIHPSGTTSTHLFNVPLIQLQGGLSILEEKSYGQNDPRTVVTQPTLLKMAPESITMLAHFPSQMQEQKIKLHRAEIDYRETKDFYGDAFAKTFSENNEVLIGNPQGDGTPPKMLLDALEVFQRKENGKTTIYVKIPVQNLGSARAHFNVVIEKPNGTTLETDLYPSQTTSKNEISVYEFPVEEVDQDSPSGTYKLRKIRVQKEYSNEENDSTKKAYYIDHNLSAHEASLSDRNIETTIEFLQN